MPNKHRIEKNLTDNQVLLGLFSRHRVIHNLLFILILSNPVLSQKFIKFNKFFEFDFKGQKTHVLKDEIFLNSSTKESGGQVCVKCSSVSLISSIFRHLIISDQNSSVLILSFSSLQHSTNDTHCSKW